MIRYLRYAFLAILGIALVTVALANREPVTLHALPADLASMTGFGYGTEMPLYLVIFGSIVVGLILGFIWEWFREHKHRVAASQNRREREKLEREVQRLKTPDPGGKDEVLALLEDAGTAR